MGVVPSMSSTPSLFPGLGIVPDSWVSSSLSSPLWTDASDKVLILPSGEFLLICSGCHSAHRLVQLLVKILAPPETCMPPIFQWDGYSIREGRARVALCSHPSAFLFSTKTTVEAPSSELHRRLANKKGIRFVAERFSHVSRPFPTCPATCRQWFCLWW